MASRKQALLELADNGRTNSRTALKFCCKIMKAGSNAWSIRRKKKGNHSVTRLLPQQALGRNKATRQTPTNKVAQLPHPPPRPGEQSDTPAARNPREALEQEDNDSSSEEGEHHTGPAIGADSEGEGEPGEEGSPRDQPAPSHAFESESQFGLGKDHPVVPVLAHALEKALNEDTHRRSGRSAFSWSTRPTPAPRVNSN